MSKRRPSRRPDTVPDPFISPSRATGLADAALALALAAAALLLYVPVLYNDFVQYDDPMYVTRNAVVKRGLTGEGLRWALTTTHSGNWFPLTWLSHMADVSLFGMNAGGHHATSAALHALNASLVFLALRSLTGSRWRSLWAALLFAAHPLRVESVAWAAERKDVLCAAFFLLALLAYAAYARRPSVGRYARVLALASLALMSKAMAVTLPFLLLLLDVWPLGRLRPAPADMGPADTGPAGVGPPGGMKRLLLEKVPLLLLSAAASAWTVAAQGAAGALRGQDLWPLGQRAANAVVCVPRYLGKVVWPAGLSVFYLHPDALPVPAVVGSVLLIVAVTAAAWAVRRRMPYLIVGWLWFLGMLVPVSGIVQPGLQALADRFTYLPSIALTMAAVWAVADLAARRPSRRPAVAPAAAVVVFALCVATWTQQGYWQNTMTLFMHALDVDEADDVAHDKVGEQLSAGKNDWMAIPHYRRSIELNPRNTFAYIHLAASLRRTGQPEQALEAFREAVRHNPGSATAHLWLGVGLSVARRYPEADAEFAEAVRLGPSIADTYVDWAISQEQRGQPEAAVPLLQEAMKVDPTDERPKASLDRLARTRPAATRPAVAAPPQAGAKLPRPDAE